MQTVQFSRDFRAGEAIHSPCGLITVGRNGITGVSEAQAAWLADADYTLPEIDRARHDPPEFLEGVQLAAERARQGVIAANETQGDADARAARAGPRKPR